MSWAITVRSHKFSVLAFRPLPPHVAHISASCQRKHETCTNNVNLRAHLNVTRVCVSVSGVYVCQGVSVRVYLSVSSDNR